MYNRYKMQEKSLEEILSFKVVRYPIKMMTKALRKMIKSKIIIILVSTQLEVPNFKRELAFYQILRGA